MGWRGVEPSVREYLRNGFRAGKRKVSPRFYANLNLSPSGLQASIGAKTFGDYLVLRPSARDRARPRQSAPNVPSLMSLEIRKSSKWGYGVFVVNGQKTVINLKARDHRQTASQTETMQGGR
jgi:hypothetical protein